MNDVKRSGETCAPAPRPERRKNGKGRVRCVLGMLVSAAVFLGPWLANLWLAFDVLSHFALQAMVTFTAFAIGYLAPFARLSIAGIVILVGLTGISLWPQYEAGKPPAVVSVPEGERALTVMSFNTWIRNDDTAAIMAEVDLRGPDVVFLYEVDRAKLDGLEPLRKRFPYRVHCVDEPGCDVAVWSKIPFRTVKTQPAGKGPSLVLIRLGPEWGGLNIAGIHSVRPPHMHAQLRQMHTLADQVRALTGPVLVVGDFNATPFSRMLREFSSRSGLRRETFLPTWPAYTVPTPQLAIDHVFISPDIKQLAPARTGGHAKSDHLPVIARISVKPEPN